MPLEILKNLLQVPDLASKSWIYEQYDSQVMNDTISTGGDASIVRVRGTNKALALTVDCTPRYVEADPFEGSIQAVAESYRNISATGAKPLAITNCLNFGNPQKPEIMGQIVKSIKGITRACKELDYPVISGNVSLYNETNGNSIQPTPAIGGVGLLKDLEHRCDTKFKNINDVIMIIGKTNGHISCSLFEREILKIDNKSNPPKVDLSQEKNNSKFIRDLISNKTINSCHDVSDGGMMVALFEMCSKNLGCKIDISQLIKTTNCDENTILFCEDQSRYIITASPSKINEIYKKSEKYSITTFIIGEVINEKIIINSHEIKIEELQKINNQVFEKNFSI